MFKESPHRGYPSSGCTDVSDNRLSINALNITQPILFESNV